MTDHPSKAERLAHNATLMVISRFAMAIGTPAMLGLLAWVSSLLLDLRAEQTRQAGQIAILETRHSARIAAIEDRQGTQSRRKDLTDGRIERLSEIANKFATDSAVLAERIRALLEGQQRPNR